MEVTSDRQQTHRGNPLLLACTETALPPSCRGSYPPLFMPVRVTGGGLQRQLPVPDLLVFVEALDELAVGDVILPQPLQLCLVFL